MIMKHQRWFNITLAHITSLVLVVLGEVACSMPRQSTTSSSEAFSEEAPQSVKRLLPFLKARHINDLASIEELSSIEGYDQGLLWLAQRGSPLMLKLRALKLVGYLKTSAALQVLIDQSASSQRASVRATSIRALTSHLKRVHGERQAQLISLVRDAAQPKSPRRLRAAAESVMSALPELFVEHSKRTAPLLNSPKLESPH